MLFGATPSIGLLHLHGRTRIPFSAVNRKGQAGYNPEMQKHHLLPCALERRHALSPILNRGKRHHVDLHDFRINGLLLPATERQARRSRLPLHRGPHPLYSEMVEARLECIQRDWDAKRHIQPVVASQEHLMRLDLLLRALRQKILTASTGRAMLNRNCPLGSQKDFGTLDDMAELLWQETRTIPERESMPA